MDDLEQTIKLSTYDLVGNVKTATDGNGNVTTFEYNALNKVRKVTYPTDETIPQNVIAYQYDVMGNLAKKISGSGIVDVYAYDAFGRAVSHTQENSDEKEAITTYVKYDSNSNKIEETDGNGVTKVNTYDVLNRLLSTKDTVKDINNAATVQTTSYEYDANGNLISTTDWRGNVTTNVYDQLDRLIEKIDAYQKSIQKLEYNNNNVQVKSTDALGNITKYAYDLNNRLISTTDPEGHITYQSYDNVGNIATKADGNYHITKYNYDEFNRLSSVENAKEEVTSYTYDLNGNMLTQTDGNGNVTTFEYNVLNLPVKKIDNGGKVPEQSGYKYDPAKVESYIYDVNGKLISKTDRNGNTTTYTYDSHGRMTSQKVGTISITYTYDNNGNQLTITDNTGTMVRTYDELNRVKTKTVPNLGTSVFTYDVVDDALDGRTAEISKDPKGNVTKKVYDKVGRLQQVIADNQTTTYTYYDNGSKQSVVYSDGTREDYTYDKDNLLKALTNKKADGTVLEAYAYTYDAAHNQISKTDSKGKTDYTYDALNRLETVIEPGGKVTAYAFDNAGNRISESVAQGGNTIVTVYTYNDQNRLMSTVAKPSEGVSETIKYTYDNNGNLTYQSKETTKPSNPLDKPKFGMFIVGQQSNNQTISEIVKDTAVYEYDELNQLIRTVTNNQTVTNTYNGEGLRVAKEVDGNLTRYMYEYDKVVLEVDKDGKQIAKNVYGTNLISRQVDNEKLYYLYNGHADVTALLDNTGNIVATYYYDAFGNIIESTGTVNNPFTFAGYQYDKETGLYYLNARMYDPVTARFLQEDTYSGDRNDPLSLNLYTYCHNEPIMYWDYSGNTEIGFTLSFANDSKTYNGATAVVQKYLLDRYNYSTMNDLYLNGVLKWGKDISEDKAIVKGANSRDKLGYYGMRTKNAVIWFQREKGIKDDGVVGSETWTAMGLPEPKSALYYWMRDDWNSLDNGYNSFGKSPNSSYALFWATQHFSPKVESPTPKTTPVVKASQAPKVNNLITQSNQFNNIFNNNVNNIFMPEPIFKVSTDQTPQVQQANSQPKKDDSILTEITGCKTKEDYIQGVKDSLDAIMMSTPVGAGIIGIGEDATTVVKAVSESEVATEAATKVAGAVNGLKMNLQLFAKDYDINKGALSKLAKELEEAYKRNGTVITKDEAKIIDEWCTEYGVTQHHTSELINSFQHWVEGLNHTHIGSTHIPFKKK